MSDKLTDKLNLDLEGLDDMEELSEEELQQMMAAYKKELAHIYRMASARRALIISRHEVNQALKLQKCDEDMRNDINAIKRKYGIHY